MGSTFGVAHSFFRPQHRFSVIVCSMLVPTVADSCRTRSVKRLISTKYMKGISEIRHYQIGRQQVVVMWKNVRNVSLKVAPPDGQVRMSVPLGYSEAKALQNLFGSIKINNIAQAEKQQAAAAKEAANATLAQAKANKELQNAEIAKQKAIQAGIETENKRIKQQKEAANTEAAVQNAAKKGLQTRSAALRLAVQENAVIEKQEKALYSDAENAGKNVVSKLVD